MADILDTNIQVYNWVKRYREHGIDGLQTKPNQGKAEKPY
ncbi:helix-turn-helix domain-containing protein [Faucicola osloensis]